MNKVSIIPNITKDRYFESTQHLVQLLNIMGITAQLSESYSDSGLNAVYLPDKELGKADMIIVLGGDGTLLGTVREYHTDNVPFLGINHGNFGFLTEVEKEDEKKLIDILNGKYVTEKRMMLRASIGDEEQYFSMNDISLHRGVGARMLNYSIYVDDAFVNSIMADGVVVSTPTGSTAYSLSAGGPIVDPTVEVLIITPICPHDLYSRSIVVPSDKTIQIKLERTGDQMATVTMDGQLWRKVPEGRVLTITGSKKVELVRSGDGAFYTKLRKKMFERG